MTITVVVVDDHPVVRGGIVALLGSEPGIDVVGEAADGADAVGLVVRLRPDAVLMDLRMPGLDGVGAIEAIRSEWPEAPIVVLTTYATDEAIVRAIEAGATGYLLKDAPPEELVDAVRRTAAGETVLAPPVAKRLVDRVRDPEAGALSLREIEVLRAVASGNTNAAIAERLHISQATVKTHLLHIYDKLAVSDRAAAVAVAYETGILSSGSSGENGPHRRTGAP
ncbi:MAG: response regulator transcription factor [Actinomycetota bacterium]